MTSLHQEDKFVKWLHLENEMLRIQCREIDLQIYFFKANPHLEKPVLNDKSFLDIARVSYKEFDETKESKMSQHMHYQFYITQRLELLEQIEKLKAEYSKL